jgi:peptidoglycan/xylan/chitin deacetylase (PgdA/CDA1 family)
MEVYLTFDDGIQDGTEEVLNVLKRTGVKATFFLVGIELVYAYRKAPAKCLELLREIYENHVIGNHTYSHTNYFFPDYYLNDGVVTDNSGSRMSILNDFLKGKDQINYFLKMISGGESIDENYPLAKNQNKPLARFPGRNNWYIPSPFFSEVSGDSRRYWTHCEPGTHKKNEQLFQAGYHVFGWNTEWKMTFDFHQDVLAQRREIVKTRTIDYSNEAEVYPAIDICAYQNLGKDRLTEDWPAVRNKIFGGAAIQNKVVVLMHDRAFRKGFDPNGKSKQTTTHVNRFGSSESDKLQSLIESLRKQNVDFRTLDEFTLSDVRTRIR